MSWWNALGIYLFSWLVYLGLPLVNLYHQARNHPFINIIAEEAKGLEKMGNYVLTPVHYLMDARVAYKISQEPHLSYEFKPRFSYENHLSLYGSLAILAAPSSLIVGSFIKGLSYLDAEVRNRHGKIADSLSSTYVSSNNSYYESLGFTLVPKEKAERLLPLGYQRKPGDEKKLADYKEGLQAIIQILEAHDIPYWMDCGTLLGAFRYGGVIPWDKDIDMAVLLPDFNNVKRALNQLDPACFVCQDWSHRTRPNTYLRVYLKKAHNHIDIYHFAIHPEERKIQYIFSNEVSEFMPEFWKKQEKKFTCPHPYERIFPLKRASLDGIEVWVPNKTQAYLQAEYGEDLSPTMLFNEITQRYEKDITHPYWKK